MEFEFVSEITFDSNYKKHNLGPETCRQAEVQMAFEALLPFPHVSFPMRSDCEIKSWRGSRWNFLWAAHVLEWDVEEEPWGLPGLWPVGVLIFEN